MNDTVVLEIVGSTTSIVKTEIKDLYIPAYLGKTGILEHHLPYITILIFGEVVYTDKNNQPHYLYIEEGFLEVHDNQVMIISDDIQTGSNLNGDEIKSRLEKVTHMIQTAKSGDLSIDELDQLLEEEKRLKIKHEIIQKLAKKVS